MDTINARFKHLHKTAAEWKTVYYDFIPEKGEIVVYDYDESDPTSRPGFKIGDGETKINRLPLYGIPLTEELTIDAGYISEYPTKEEIIEPPIDEEPETGEDVNES